MSDLLSLRPRDREALKQLQALRALKEGGAKEPP